MPGGNLSCCWKKPPNGSLNGMPTTPVSLWMKTGDPFIKESLPRWRAHWRVGRPGLRPYSCICVTSTLACWAWSIWGGVLQEVGGEIDADYTRALPYPVYTWGISTAPLFATSLINLCLPSLSSSLQQECVSLKGTWPTPTPSTAAASEDRFLIALVFYAEDPREHTLIILS